MSQQDNICLSGGAKGADIFWGIAAEGVGHEVVHWSFAGHNIEAENYICELNDHQLRVADPFLELANKSLARKWPTLSVNTNNLLRRNFYQVHYSNSVYAISEFVNDSSVLKISGGTAWACQMFIDKWLYIPTKIKDIPIFFFDQISKTWYTWSGQWQAILKPPRPQGIYAGIGTRKLTEDGQKAIAAVYE